MSHKDFLFTLYVAQLLQSWNTLYTKKYSLRSAGS